MYSVLADVIGIFDRNVDLKTEIWDVGTATDPRGSATVPDKDFSASSQLSLPGPVKIPRVFINVSLFFC
jgi:hypothetical protein